MIIDVFPFFNELEILEIRLHELKNVVDLHVLVESEETFSGNKKPLYYWNNRDRFSEFHRKIRHHVSPKLKGPIETVWDRQIKQRDYVYSYLVHICDDEDIILVGDVDEIPRASLFPISFTTEKYGEVELVSFAQRNHMYYLNLMRPGGWYGTAAVKFKNLRNKYDKSLFKVRSFRRHSRKLRTGGWHFRDMGGIEAVQLKLKSSGHYNDKLAKMLLKDPKMLKDRMEKNRMVKSRKLVVEPLELLPEYVVNNINKFEHMFTEERDE